MQKNKEALKQKMVDNTIIGRENGRYFAVYGR